jgi:hypothetical protein
MDFNTIIFTALFLGILLAFLYGLKRILDAETFKTLTNKIVAYIIKAEQEIQGYKKGTERLNEVVENVIANATTRERKLLNKINVKGLVTNIFTYVVSPIFFKRAMR